jgi:hypothetical protein
VNDIPLARDLAVFYSIALILLSVSCHVLLSLRRDAVSSGLQGLIDTSSIATSILTGKC